MFAWLLPAVRNLPAWIRLGLTAGSAATTGALFVHALKTDFGLWGADAAFPCDLAILSVLVIA